MRKKDNPMLITFENLPEKDRWNACLRELENNYTLSFKDMCRILKCSRSWAMKYLKPHLHYIYVSNGAGQGINYLYAASRALNRNLERNSTWYSKSEFENLIKSHIVDVTRQTAIVPMESLIEKGYLKEFRNKWEIAKKLWKNKQYESSLALEKEIFANYTTDLGRTMYDDAPNKYKRSDTEAVADTIDALDLNELVAVHDKRKYGDADEEIYRFLFDKAYYRLVLKLPDADGVMSEKVYYYPSHKGSLEDQILVKNIYVSV